MQGHLTHDIGHSYSWELRLLVNRAYAYWSIGDAETAEAIEAIICGGWPDIALDILEVTP